MGPGFEETYTIYVAMSGTRSRSRARRGYSAAVPSTNRRMSIATRAGPLPQELADRSRLCWPPAEKNNETGVSDTAVREQSPPRRPRRLRRRMRAQLERELVHYGTRRRGPVAPIGEPQRRQRRDGAGPKASPVTPCTTIQATIAAITKATNLVATTPGTQVTWISSASVCRRFLPWARITRF